MERDSNPASRSIFADFLDVVEVLFYFFENFGTTQRQLKFL